MNLQEFTARYAHTLHRDPNTQESYIKLTVADLSELGQMQQALLNGIAMLTQLDDDQRKEAEHSMYWLCRICLLYTSPSPRDLSTSRMPSSA